MTKLDQKNGNETKSDNFPWDMFKSETVSFFDRKTLKHFNDFQNGNFSALRLRLIQTMEMKENQTFSHEAYSN